MKTLSPSSRLVSAVVVFALTMLALVGLVRPDATGVAVAASPAGETLSAGWATPATTGSDAPVASPSAGPATPATTGPSAVVTSNLTVAPTTTTSACAPTDQDRYVYHPSRLDVQAACIRVTGTVAAIRQEADGDLHILLALDPAYTTLLTPANQGEELGDLVVEPVCVRSVTQADAVALCASDPDPFSAAFPVVGEPVWMEGRYVFDLQHGGWAELHPLYRWGDR